jgi:hypothetical protein
MTESKEKEKESGSYGFVIGVVILCVASIPMLQSVVGIYFAA